MKVFEMTAGPIAANKIKYDNRICFSSFTTFINETVISFI